MKIYFMKTSLELIALKLTIFFMFKATTSANSFYSLTKFIGPL